MQAMQCLACEAASKISATMLYNQKTIFQFLCLVVVRVCLFSVPSGAQFCRVAAAPRHRGQLNLL